MKTDGKMSYKGFVFPLNPSVISIRHNRKTAASRIPYGNDFVEDIGSSGRVITGKGEFVGENCIRDFMKLKTVMDQGGGGILYIPSQKPVYAVLESLELSASDTQGAIGYSFRFIESFDTIQSNKKTFCYGNGSNCLWDISYKYAISINLLMQLNPWIKRPDIPIYAWEKVALC